MNNRTIPGDVRDKNRFQRTALRTAAEPDRLAPWEGRALERRKNVGTAAVVCNVVLVAFTCLVMATDGVSREVPYLVFTVLLLAVPTLSAALLVQRGPHRTDGVTDSSPAMQTASQIGVLCNIWLLATACWAIYDRYPHPNEEGFLAYVAVVLLAPILSIAALVAGSKWSVGRRSSVA